MAVNVEFKAQTKDLQDGVDRAKDAIAQFQRPVDQLNTSFAQLQGTANNLNASTANLNATLDKFSDSITKASTASAQFHGSVQQASGSTSKFGVLVEGVEKLAIVFSLAGAALKIFATSSALQYAAIGTAAYLGADKIKASMAQAAVSQAAGFAAMIAWPLRVAAAIGAIGVAIDKITVLGIENAQKLAQVAKDAGAASVSTDFFQRMVQGADNVAKAADAMKQALAKFQQVNIAQLGGSDLQKELDNLTKWGNFANNSGVAEFKSATTVEAKWKAIVDLITQAMHQGQRLAALDLAGKFLPDSMMEGLRRDGDYLKEISNEASSIKPVEIYSNDEIARGIDVNNRLEQAKQILADKWEPVLKDLRSLSLDFADSLADWYLWFAKIAGVIETVEEKVKALAGWFNQLRADHPILTAPMLGPYFGLAQVRDYFSGGGGLIEGANAADAPTGGATPAELSRAKKYLAAGLGDPAAVRRAMAEATAFQYQLQPDTSHPDPGKDNHDEQRAAIAAMQGQIEAASQAFQKNEVLLNAGVAIHAVSEDQKTQLTLAAIKKREDADIAAIDKVLARDDLTKTETQRIENEKTKIVEAANLQRLQITAQTLQRETQEWEAVLKPIEGAWNSQLRSLLAGTETWSQAMRKILGDLILDFIEKMESIGVEKLAGTLAGALGGPQSMLGGLLGGGGAAAATTANTTAVTALTTAITANTAALGGSAVATTAGTTATVADTAATTVQSGITLTSIGTTLANTLALIPNTLAIVTNTIATFASKLIPGFDVGSWELPSDTIAKVHKGEMIVPAQGGRADALRAMLGSGIPRPALASLEIGSASAAGGRGTSNSFNMRDAQFHIHAPAGQPVDGAQVARDFVRSVRRQGIFAPNRYRHMTA
jgi:hypothetical protein